MVLRDFCTHVISEDLFLWVCEDRGKVFSEGVALVLVEIREPDVVEVFVDAEDTTHFVAVLSDVPREGVVATSNPPDDENMHFLLEGNADGSEMFLQRRREVVRETPCDGALCVLDRLPVESARSHARATSDEHAEHGGADPSPERPEY